jgi:5'-nucleotidase (lipoprotein e(P4) family)
MKNRICLAALIFSAFCLNACYQHTDNVSPGLQLQPAGQAWGALYQQRAAEYKALCFQAYNIAALRLNQQLKTKPQKPLAIITDIDETVLDNSPYFSRLSKKGELYTDSSWVKWTAEIKCDTVPGAVRFLKDASARGAVIFYITNRFQQELSPTIKNLQKWGLPNADSAHVLLMNLNNSSKEARRLSVQKNYNIALLIGDVLADFNKYFDHLDVHQRFAHTTEKANSFGQKFIILPNAMYGTWEDVLYKAKGANTIKEKNEVLLNDLKD